MIATKAMCRPCCEARRWAVIPDDSVLPKQRKLECCVCGERDVPLGPIADWYDPMPTWDDRLWAPPKNPRA